MAPHKYTLTECCKRRILGNQHLEIGPRELLEQNIMLNKLLLSIAGYPSQMIHVMIFLAGNLEYGKHKFAMLSYMNLLCLLQLYVI